MYSAAAVFCPRRKGLFMSALRVEKYCQVSLQVASSQVNECILTEILSQNSAEDLYCCTADPANAA
jgi:hypothetical protein